jgi:phosphoglycerol transferase MdoB-like AlkP superfamily enzyme
VGLIAAGMPTGDSPEKAERYYRYMNGHQQTQILPVQSWHVNWMALAWMWGFVVVLSIAIIWWIWQYRTTRQRTGIYPIDSFGGYTTELAGPSTLFFLLLSLIIAAFAVALIAGHLIWGQKF